MRAPEEWRVQSRAGRSAAQHVTGCTGAPACFSGGEACSGCAPTQEAAASGCAVLPPAAAAPCCRLQARVVLPGAPAAGTGPGHALHDAP